MDKKVNEKKKKYAIVITFLVLMICITGGTYAYFALTASNNSITGSVGGASLNLEVTKVYPTSEHSSKNMIPQLESTLDEAISLEHKCVDGNGNVICEVYSATVTNVGSTTSVLNGTISFEMTGQTNFEEPYYLPAGLYDANDNVVFTWEQLESFGWDVEDSNSNYTSIDQITDVANSSINITKIVIPEGVTIIKDLAFSNEYNKSLDSIKEIILPTTLTTIGSYAFLNLNGLNSIEIPVSVTNIERYAFGMTYNLTTIYYSGNAEVDNHIWSADRATILPGKSLKIPMPNLKWKRINDSNTLGEYESYYASSDKALFEENKSFTANGSSTYYFVFWIDETGEVQKDNGEFRANIEFDSSTGGLTSTLDTLRLSKYIESLYNDGSSINTIHIADDSSKQQVHLNSNQALMKVEQGSTYGVEYRYYGGNYKSGYVEPDNYVEFNGELWRIISSSKVFSSESDTIGSMRVRIIRESYIEGYYPYDEGGYNNWVASSLMCQLNTLYYNDTISACSGVNFSSIDISLDSKSKSLIDNALWYLGGSSEYEGLYVDDFYEFERGTSVSNASNPYRWTGKVGIMYPSDYMYAADLSMCKAPAYGMDEYDKDHFDYSSYVCSNVNWLYGGKDHWLISPNSGNGQGSYFVSGEGYVMVGSNGSVDRSIWPVVVLKSNVKMLGGEGTRNNPYKIGI